MEAHKPPILAGEQASPDAGVCPLNVADKETEIEKIHSVIASARPVWSRFALLIALVAVCMALPAGWIARQWMFEESRPIRFRDDVQRGFYWGRVALEQGYWNVYEPRRDQLPSDQLWIDYAPLRLAIMRYWAGVNETRFPGQSEYENTYAFAKPVLMVNTIVELFSAVGLFLLVRHWVVRATSPSPRRLPVPGWRRRWLTQATTDARPRAVHPLQGVTTGLWAAVLLWLNPAMILSGYAWPTWDLWVVPFFIWAVYFACVDWWFLSGVMIAIGALLKGQQLSVACVFIMWPLVAGAPGLALSLLMTTVVAVVARLWLSGDGVFERIVGNVAGNIAIAAGLAFAVAAACGANWRAILHWLGGFVFALALVVSGWMLRDKITGDIRWAAVVWVLLVACAVPLAVWAIKRWTEWRWVAWRDLGITWAAAVGLALLLCMPLFDASDAWFQCGWNFGTRHFDRLIVGVPDNLPALLRYRFDFADRETDIVVLKIPAHLQFGWPGEDIYVSLKTLMKAIFVLLMLPCAAAAGWHASRNDKRFLVAMTTPWLLFYCLPLQIHERYLLFFAGTSACLIAAGLGPLLLHAFLSLVTFASILFLLLKPERRATWAFEKPDSIFITNGDMWRAWIGATHPDLAWAVLFCAAICLYLTLTRSRQDIGGTGALARGVNEDTGEAPVPLAN